MLIKQSYRDVETTANGVKGTMRVIIIEPNVPEYPDAKFPGCVVFSEIYQVSGPVERFAGQIASQGFICACPSSFHEFEGPEPLPYDTEGTDRGNKYKAEKTIAGYDEDATLSVDVLMSLPQCTGRIAATGMCLGGHLALRAAFDPRILATFCWFATDVHSATLGKGNSDDTLIKIKNGDMDYKGEVAMVFGKQDTHVPREGRDLVRKTLEDANVIFSLHEVQAQHAFIRDTSSKGRWDAALTRGLFGMMMEMFERCVARNLGRRVRSGGNVEHVC
ncbi:putative Carboxymethylenebutenolidase [Filobasidium floriforme]|uniref:putative Carboxymethylenebutenolidase n=1 Tax=Filobasidium floriforme TaxID=5210 RepID=UPI001E8D7420|nr:putative Carboxymethylenebutenolidase [Filobasidium floriforme]KAH8084046.1 putative Carboxymethylenebutenolidase [Filobasidium floriforme]